MRTKSNQETKLVKLESFDFLIYPKAQSPDAGRKVNLKILFSRYLQRNVAEWLTSAIPSVNSVVTALVLVHLQAPPLPGPTLLEPLPHPPFPCKKHQTPGWFSGAAPAPASLVSHVETTSRGRGAGSGSAVLRDHWSEAGSAGGRAEPARPPGAGRAPCTDQAGAQAQVTQKGRSVPRAPGFSLDQKLLPVSSLEKATQSRSDQSTNRHAYTAGPATQTGEGQHVLGKTNMAVE